MRKIAKKSNLQNINLQLDIYPEMFNKKYLPYLFDYSHRYNVYYGGRSSGKSAFIAQKLIIKCLNDKRRMLVLIKQTNRVDETVWRLFIDTLESFQIIDKIKMNKSEHTMTFPNGSWIKFSGMDSSEKAKGFVNIDTVFFEETSDFTEDDIESIDGTLRGKAKFKELYFAFNPVSKANIVYKRWFAEGVNLDDTFILKSTYLDNKWCDIKEVERLERLKERNPARYKIEALGDFVTLSKLVFSYIKQKLDVDELIKNNPNLITCLGLDWGFNDPTTVICSLYDDKNKKLYIVDEIYKKGLTNSQIATLIKEKGWHKNIIIADCANPKDIKDLQKMGIDKIKPCKKGADSIMHGIRKMQDMKLIVNEACENIITELDNYCFIKDKNTGEYIDKPIDNFNHCIDAIRYSIQIIRKQAKRITVRL